MTEAQKDTLCGKGTLAYPQSYNPIELEALALEFALEDCEDLPKEAIKKLGKGMFKFVIKINHKMLYHILTNRPEIDSPYIDSKIFQSLFKIPRHQSYLIWNPRDTWGHLGPLLLPLWNP